MAHLRVPRLFLKIFIATVPDDFSVRRCGNLTAETLWPFMIWARRILTASRHFVSPTYSQFLKNIKTIIIKKTYNLKHQLVAPASLFIGEISPSGSEWQSFTLLLFKGKIIFV